MHRTAKSGAGAAVPGQGWWALPDLVQGRRCGDGI